MPTERTSGVIVLSTHVRTFKLLGVILYHLLLNVILNVANYRTIAGVFPKYVYAKNGSAFISFLQIICSQPNF